MTTKQTLPTAGWWLTLSRGSVCDDCAEQIPSGQEFAFHYDPLGVLCQVCADRKGLDVKLSKKVKKPRAQMQLAL